MGPILAVIRALLGTLMLVAVAINFSNVIGRYAFGKPIFWAEEAMIFIQVWTVMIGAALVAASDAHLRMDAAEHLAPPELKRWLDGFTTMLLLAASLAVVVLSARIVLGMLQSGQKSVALELPMSIPYSALPIGFGVIALVALIRLVTLWRARSIASMHAPGEPGREG